MGEISIFHRGAASVALLISIAIGLLLTKTNGKWNISNLISSLDKNSGLMPQFQVGVEDVVETGSSDTIVNLYLCKSGDIDCALKNEKTRISRAGGMANMLTLASKQFNLTFDRVYDEYGRSVVGLGPDLEDDSLLYFVEPGRHFQWPVNDINGEGNQKIPRNVESPIEGKPITIRAVSSEPRVFVIENFIDDEEIDYFIQYSKKHGERSTTGIGDSSTHNVNRTSSTAWDTSSKIAKRVINRAFALVNVQYNVLQSDAVQVIRYGADQRYNLHHDYFDELSGYPDWDTKELSATNRLLTLLLYLTPVPKGGATVFPRADQDKSYWNEHESSQEAEEEPSLAGIENKMDSCASRKGIKVYPRKGNAILFYSQHPNGTLDASSLHGGCPVVTGEKFAANVWIWSANRPDLQGGSIAKSKGDCSGTFQITVENKRPEKVDVMWKASANGLEFILDVDGNASRGINSSEGHQFVVLDKVTKQRLTEFTVTCKGVRKFTVN
eukprot:g2673.t1